MAIHNISNGENLTKIAAKYGTTVDELIKLNPDLKDHPNTIFAGQTLNIPDAPSNTPYPGLGVERQEDGIPKAPWQEDAPKPQGAKSPEQATKTQQSSAAGYVALGAMGAIAGQQVWKEGIEPRIPAMKAKATKIGKNAQEIINKAKARKAEFVNKAKTKSAEYVNKAKAAKAEVINKAKNKKAEIVNKAKSAKAEVVNKAKTKKAEIVNKAKAAKTEVVNKAKAAKAKAVNRAKQMTKFDPATQAKLNRTRVNAKIAGKEFVKTFKTSGKAIFKTAAGKAASVLAVGIEAYNVGEATTQGYKKGGVKGAVKSGSKQVIKSGGTLAGMAAGAAAGAVIGGPVGAVAGAVVGGIVGEKAGEKVAKAAGKAFRAVKGWFS